MLPKCFKCFRTVSVRIVSKQTPAVLRSNAFLFEREGGFRLTPRFCAKIPNFGAKPGFSPFPRYQKFGASGQCVVSHLKLANNDSCRTLKKKKHTRCQYNTKKNVIHRV